MTWVVHVGGLVRTGSGAVKDALLDTGWFTTLKGKSSTLTESRLFVGERTIPDFVRDAGEIGGADVLALWTAGTRQPDGARISDATARFLERTSRTHAVNHKAFLRVEDTPLREAAQAVAERIARATEGVARAEAYISGTYAAIRSLLPSGDQMVLIDNDPAVTEHLLTHLRLDERIVFVGVIRDLSDQFVDRRTGIVPHHSRPKNLAYMTISALRRRPRFRVLETAAKEFPDRCIIVEFEPFVTDPAYRERFRAAVSRAPHRLPGDRARLDPERSATNIGLPVPRGDALQHAAFTRLLDRDYRAARRRSGPEVWPDAVADG